MDPLSIILVFVLLGTLTVLGIVLVGLGIRRLQSEVHVGRTSGTKALFVSLDILIAALGLSLAFYSVLAAFRIVWGL